MITCVTELSYLEVSDNTNTDISKLLLNKSKQRKFDPVWRRHLSDEFVMGKFPRLYHAIINTSPSLSPDNRLSKF